MARCATRIQKQQDFQVDLCLGASASLVVHSNLLAHLVLLLVMVVSMTPSPTRHLDNRCHSPTQTAATEEGAHRCLLLYC